MTSPRRETFVRTAEVWVPTADGERLELASATHGGAARFRAAGAPLECDADADLPGAAWASGHAVLRPARAESVFTGARETASPGLAATLAFPVGDTGGLRAVVVLGCGRRDANGGVLEIWHRADERPELGVAAGHYGRLDRFQRLSVALRLAPGSGLPGRTWQTGLPQVMEDLPHADSFLRAAAAESEGLATGVGLPVFRGTGLGAVVLLLATAGTPLAGALEVWTPGDDDHPPRLEAGIRAPGGPVGAGLAAPAWTARVPRALPAAELLDPPHAAAAAAAGLSQGLVLPIVRGARVPAIVLLLL